MRDDRNNKDPTLKNVALVDIIKNATLTSGNTTFTQALRQGLTGSYGDLNDYMRTITQLKDMGKVVDDLGISVGKFNDDGTVAGANFSKFSGNLRTALDTAIGGRTMSVDDLKAQFDTISTFVNTTMPDLLKALASGQKTWVDQMAALKKTYEDAAQQADSYGLDGGALRQKYESLYDQSKATQEGTLSQNADTVRARYLSATGDHQGAALLNFDVSAAQQRQQLKTSWENYLGDAYASQKAYIDQATALDKTLAAERLNIQKQYADQAKQASLSAAQSLTTSFGSLTDYARSLATSDYSPLSIQDQYQVANDNVAKDYNAAMAGDSDALGRFQGDMETTLRLSQKYWGSGTGYADDFQRLTEMLGGLSGADSDKLTASLVEKLCKKQEDAMLALRDKMQELLQQVQLIQAQQKQASNNEALRPRRA